MDLRDALLGALPLRADGLERLGGGEELGRLLVVRARHLEDERRLGERALRVARAEQAEDRGLVGVLVDRDRHRGELGAGGVVARLRVGRLLLHPGERGLRRGVRLAVGVVLLADLVHLGLQAVYLRLNLADGRRGGGPGPGRAGVDGEAGGGGDGDCEDGAAPDLGCAGKVLGHKALSHDAVTLRSPCPADKPEAGDHGSEGNGRISTGSRKPHEMITIRRGCGAVSDVVTVRPCQDQLTDGADVRPGLAFATR